MNIGIITGASSGMGKEFVKLTMQNHLDLDEIWVIARRKERLEAWPSLYKEQKFRILPLDLQKKEDVECLKQILEETQPHIELFVHCAGFGIMGKIQDISMEEQAEMVDVNCRSVVEILLFATSLYEIQRAHDLYGFRSSISSTARICCLCGK